MGSGQWAVGSSQWSVVRCRDSPAWTAGQPGGEGSAIGEIGFRGHALRRPSFSKPRCLKAKMPGQHDFGRTPLLNSLYRIRSALNRQSTHQQTIHSSPDDSRFTRCSCLQPKVLSSVGDPAFTTHPGHGSIQFSAEERSRFQQAVLDSPEDRVLNRRSCREWQFVPFRPTDVKLLRRLPRLGAAV